MKQGWLLIASVTVACSASDAGLSSNAVADTLPGGLIRVTNTGPTAWADTSGWTLVLEHTIRPVEGSPGEIGSPRGIVADSRGRVYLYERRPIAINQYAASGEWLQSISGEGSGPGEISNNGLLMIANDTLVFHDSNQTRTQLWTTDGEFIRGWSSLCCMSMPVTADREGRIPIPGMVFPQSEGGGFLEGGGLVRYRLDGSVTDTIALTSGPGPGKVWRFETAGGTNINSVPMQPDQLQKLGPDGLLYHGDQAEYRIFVSRTGRDTLRSFSAPGMSVAIPDSVRERVIARAIEQTPELEGVAKIADLPSTYTPWTGFTFDGAGNVWVLAAGPLGESDHFDVFAPDGRLLGAVPSPLRRLYLTYWTGDHVYALVEDETTGLPEIRVYRINRQVG